MPSAKPSTRSSIGCASYLKSPALPVPARFRNPPCIGASTFSSRWCCSWRWFQRARPKPAAPALQAVRLDAEDLTADRLPEDGWLELAARSIAEGNFRFALRAYYLANLAWLGRHEFLTIHPGKTNREYELELRRRARGFAEARQQFAANIAAFERAWYGQHAVSAEDAAEFRERTESTKSTLAAPQGAVA
jgi:hypothetical protein